MASISPAALELDVQFADGLSLEVAGARQLHRSAQRREPLSAQPRALGRRQRRPAATDGGGVFHRKGALDLERRLLVTAPSDGVARETACIGSACAGVFRSGRTEIELSQGFAAALRCGEGAHVQDEPLEIPRRLGNGLERHQRTLRDLHLEEGCGARQEVGGRQKVPPVALRASHQGARDGEPGGRERRADQKTARGFASDGLVAAGGPDLPGKSVELLPLMAESGSSRPRSM